MKRIILTGGVACGKSTVLDALRPYFEPLRFFDSDACVKEILTMADSVRWIRENFGEDYVSAGEIVHRRALRELIFEDEISRKKLENFLHPRVRERATLAAKAAEDLGDKRFIFDVPLFFETGKQYPSDLVVSVLCSPHTQMTRLLERDQATESLAKRMIEAQWTVWDKIPGSHVVIWNDGGREVLEEQVFLLAQILKGL